MKKGPRTVVCYICGREYGRSSIEIHQRQCGEKFLKIQAQKPKHLQKPLPNPPEITSAIIEKVAQGSGKTLADLSPEELQQVQNEAAYDAYNTQTLVPCAFCGRTFLEDKLEIHNRSCKEGNESKAVAKSRTDRKDSSPNRTVRRKNSLPSSTGTLSGAFSSNRKTIVRSDDISTRLDALENLALQLVKEIQELKHLSY